MGSHKKRKAKEVPWARGLPESGGGEGIATPSRTQRWSKPTRQVQGRISEKKILKEIGAKIHPNSGAGRTKEDGHSEEELIEVKDALKSFTLNAKDLNMTRKRAAQQGKQGMWLIKFPGFILECRIRTRWNENGE